MVIDMTTTLKQMDAERAKRCAEFGGNDREWSKYTLRHEYAVGTNGTSYRGTTGAKLHLLMVDRVVADREPKAGTFKVGDAASIRGLCTSSGRHSGQFVGTIVAGRDVKDITCDKCLKIVARLTK